MEYNLNYYAKEYQHGWTVWLERDGQKFQIGSAIKTDVEVDALVKGIGLTKEPLNIKTKLIYAMDRIEKLEHANDTMRNALKILGARVIE